MNRTTTILCAALGLGLTLTLSKLHAGITAVVDPATKTISFEGSSQRIQQPTSWDFRWGKVGVHAHLATPDVNPLQVVGTPTDLLWTFSLPIIIGWDETGVPEQVIGQDQDHTTQPSSTPITAFPTELVSYASLAPAAAFEALLAQGDFVLPAIWGAAEPLTFTLKRVSDNDNDGVPDDLDLCPNSDLRDSVWIGGCDSGVSNDIDGALVDADGCSLADYLAHQLTTAATGARNHGRFVSTMARYLNALVRSGIITGAEHGALMSCNGSANRFDFLLP